MDRLAALGSGTWAFFRNSIYSSNFRELVSVPKRMNSAACRGSGRVIVSCSTLPWGVSPHKDRVGVFGCFSYLTELPVLPRVRISEEANERTFSMHQLLMESSTSTETKRGICDSAARREKSIEGGGTGQARPGASNAKRVASIAFSGCTCTFPSDPDRTHRPQEIDDWAHDISYLEKKERCTI